MALRLVIAFSDNLRVWPLIDGTVKPQNIELDFIITPSSERHYRNLKYDEFDVSEMSMSHTLVAKERSDGTKWDWSALPVFFTKIFPFSDFHVSTASGIEHLNDLRGKRVGVPDYQMTAALWMRAMLKELHDIDPKDITWYNGRTRELSHGAVFGQEQSSPPGIVPNWLTEDQTLDVMLAQGELDAALFLELAAHGEMPSSRFQRVFVTKDRYGGTPLTGNPRIRRLFEDSGRQVHIEYYQRTGVIPANHFVIIQGRLLREHPWVALELYKAFQRAKEMAYEKARELRWGYLMFEGKDFGEQAATFGEDPYQLGIRANRRMLETLFRSSFEQGLTKKLARIEEIFCPSILDT